MVLLFTQHLLHFLDRIKYILYISPALSSNLQGVPLDCYLLLLKTCAISATDS